MRPCYHAQVINRSHIKRHDGFVLFDAHFTINTSVDQIVSYMENLVENDGTIKDYEIVIIELPHLP